ncbi:hypothetical protein SLA2020_391310 [Shorea laevis]
MGDATLLAKENFPIADNKMKGEKKASGARLADITNLQQRPKLSTQDAKMRLSPSFNTKEYIEKLQKENMTLMKVIADRNKVIELSGIELQKMRINLQKMQQQNLQLAQAHSQMLAELNAGKDRLRALQHELGCKNGLLKARNLEAEGKAKAGIFQTSGHLVPTKKLDKPDEHEENKPCNTNRRRRSKIESSGSSTVKPIHSAMEKVGKKRFKSQESEPTEDAFETDDTEFPVSPPHDGMVHERCPSSCGSSVQMEQEQGSASGVETQELRTSVGRPLHHVVEKADNKRVLSRRKSTRLQSQVPEPTEDVLEMDEAKYRISPLHEETLHLNVPVLSGSSVQKEQEQGNRATGVKTRELRTSVGRPLQDVVEKADNKRVPSKRKSTRLQSQVPEPTEDVFEIDDTKFPISSLHEEMVHVNVPASSASSTPKEEQGGINAPEGEVQELRRTSVGRPLRKAAEKVQSYKEIPLKVKMRRPE